METSSKFNGDTAEHAKTLRSLLEDTFSGMECRKALTYAGGDFLKASEHLASGAWRQFKLISWRGTFDASVERLVGETGQSPQNCLEALKDCAGNVDFALKKLKGHPLLTAAQLK